MKQWTIGKRIVIGFSVLLTLFLALAASSWYQSSLLGNSLRALTMDAVPGIRLTGDLVRETMTYRVISLRHVMSTDVEEMKALDVAADQQAEKIVGVLERYKQTISADEERQIEQRIETTLAAYRSVAREMRKLSSENKNTEAIAFSKSTVAPAYSAFEGEVLKAKEFNVNMASDVTEQANRAIHTSNVMTMVVVSIGFLFGVAGAFVTTRSIAKALRAIASSLDEGADQVASAAGQVSSSSQSLAEGASEQAASLEETSASLEEVASMTKRNAEGAQQAKALATQTREAADIGATDMEAMRIAMDEIKASSSDISKIIKTIDEIAFQTNILALNAAVEAARAGEAGMGFAVVAEEVRSLAQRSAQSAKETAAKIEVAVAKSEHGVIISGKVALSLSEIVDKARKVDGLVAEIATASIEQTQGINQVNTAVGQMDKVTQSNAGNAEETAAASEELSAQSVSMRDTVGHLLRLIGGEMRTANATSGKPGRATAVKNSAESGETVQASKLMRPTLIRASAGAPQARVAETADILSFKDF